MPAARERPSATLDEVRALAHPLRLRIIRLTYDRSLTNKELASELKTIAGVELPVGSLDITLYRDDLMGHSAGSQPVIRRTEMPFELDGRVILLVDDVLYTGRTIRAALDALIDFGRPRAIQLVALVDRGHRELPIRADYVGRNIPTSRQQTVHVRLTEIDGRDEVEVEG